jgi:hypothetical protein
VTGEPLRRYEHDHPGSLIHVDVTKFGNIPRRRRSPLRRPPTMRLEPGSYRFSDAPTFTLDVDILQEGDRLGNADAGCAVGYQGALS